MIFISALTSIAKLLDQIFSFLWTMILDLLKILDMLASVLLDVPQLLSYFLPPSVAGLFVLALTVTVVYRISGRD